MKQLQLLGFATLLICGTLQAETKDKPLTKDEAAWLEAQLTAYREKALFDAIASGDDSQIRELIKKGISVNARNSKGNTAIQEAVEAGHLTTVQLLIYAGADLQVVGRSGRTLVHDACWYKKSVELCRFVLEQDLDPSQPNNYGTTPLHIIWGPETTRALLDAGANLEARDAEGRTPADAAVRHRDLSAVEILTNAGANLQTVDKEGNTLVHSACRGSSGCNLECCRFILEQDVDPNQRNKDGCTALHGAAYFGNIETAVLLLKAGAQREMQNLQGETAYDTVVEERIAAEERIATGEPYCENYLKKLENLAALLKPDSIARREEARKAWTRTSIIAAVAAHVILSNVR